MMQATLRFEECPLQQNSQCQKRFRTFKGPFRVMRLCLFGFAIPAALISLPLYLRYHVYVSQIYPFAVSDMRLLDRRISTVWCEKQLVKMNATFNAFLLPSAPLVAAKHKPISMVRDLLLEDDMKEYWGFYLIKGSTVTVSTCVRWPGASLIVIRGHKHLHDCAYIGDDSSEELDELLEMISEEAAKANDTFPNAPLLMKRHHPNVRFHDPSHSNATSNHSIDKEEMEDTSDAVDPKQWRNLLNLLSHKSNATKKKRKLAKDLKVPLSRKPTSNRNSSFSTENPVVNSTAKEDLEPEIVTSSEELFMEISKKLDALGERQDNVLRKLNERRNKSVNYRQRRDLEAAMQKFNLDDEGRDEGLEEGFRSDGIADHRGFINETDLFDRSNSEFWSSFSSSEEALLNCEGLILNLPLTPHVGCSQGSSESQLDRASLVNTISYIVPRNGYYFFVFNSENEIQTNYIRVQFHLNKTMYDVSNPVSSCANATESCSLNLGFFSEEKTVMEFPVLSNETRWNEEFVVVSECQPRTVIYVFCVMSVPIFILFFAFH